jgi:hypothetical protein
MWQLSTREVAILIWISIALLGMLLHRTLRARVVSLVKALFQRKLGFVVAAAGVWTLASVWVLRLLGTWSNDLLKDTILWYLLTGLGLLFSKLNSPSGEDLRRDVLRDTIGVIVIVEYVISTYTLPLPFELMLVPLLVFLGGLQGVAGSKPEFRQVERVLSGLTSLVGLIMLSLAAWSAAKDWKVLGSAATVVNLFLPLQLSALFLPFLYGFVVYAAYESLFIRMGRPGPGGRWQSPSWRVKWHLLRKVGLRLGRIREFSKQLAGRFWVGRSVDELNRFLAEASAAREAVGTERIPNDRDA